MKSFATIVVIFVNFELIDGTVEMNIVHFTLKIKLKKGGLLLTIGDHTHVLHLFFMFLSIDMRQYIQE